MDSRQVEQANNIPLTLMVCHSTGDTNAIIEAAKVVSTNEKVHILTIGEAAITLASKNQ